MTTVVSVALKTNISFLSLYVAYKFSVLLFCVSSVRLTLLEHAGFGADGKVQVSC